MVQKRMFQVDADTGELQEGFMAYVAPKRVNGFGRRWVAMAQDDFVLQLARVGALSGDALRVFLALVAHLDYENFVVTPQAEIAKRIGMQPSNFNRGLSALIAEGVIEKGPKIGRMASLRISPAYVWKGTASNHKKALEDRMKARGLSVVSNDAAARDELEAAGQLRLDGADEPGMGSASA
jgi:hypothetical protein